MAKFYKVSLVVLVIQMSVQFSTSMYGIYRGDMDSFSRNTLNLKHLPKKCRRNYCRCGELETFTYGYDEGYDKGDHRRGKCVKNAEFQQQSGCTHFSTHSGDITPIQIVHLKDSKTQVAFRFFNKEVCTWQWKSTNYTVHGDNRNWAPTQSNPGGITLLNVDVTVIGNILKVIGNILKINNPQELLLMFPGMLLKIQIECSTFGSPLSKKHETCLLLKIEGQTNITDFPTTSPTTTSSSTSSITSPSTPFPTSLKSSTSTPTNQISEVPVKSQTDDHITNASPITTVPGLSTSTLSDPENNESEGDDNDSINLVPIVVPILLLFVLLVVLFGVFLYRKRQRSMSSNIDKDLYDDYSLPRHATLTKTPQDSLQSYAVPGSQINTTPIYDTVYENTNVPHRNSPNHYEIEDDYDPTIPEVNQNPTDHISPQSSYTNPSTDIYQDIDFNQAPRSTANSTDNLGYLNQSNESPYYHSLEKDTSNENIYDRVAEDPQEHIYNVLEKPN